MIATIPLQSGSQHFELATSLDGTTFFLEFRWNERANAWFLTLKDAEQNVLMASRRLVINFPLTSRFRVLGMPKGELFVIDTSGKDLEPTADDLGTRVQLYYVEADDLPAAAKV